MLLAEHKKYHEMSPKDVVKQEQSVMSIDVARTTTHTGEQFHVTIPVYISDSREELRDRMQFCLSIMQERMEEENEAMNRMNAAVQTERVRGESIRRNQLKLKKDRKELLIRSKREGWNKEVTDNELNDLQQKFETAQKTLLEGTAEEAVQ